MNIPKYLESSVRSSNHKEEAKTREGLFILISELLTFSKRNDFEFQDYTLEILVRIHIIFVII